MARYPIFDGVPEDIDVITGFDHQYPGFFLMIESFRGANRGTPRTTFFTTSKIIPAW
jgi:hypothetical protein